MDGYAGKGHQVLLIDDDSEFCELMTDYLDVHSFAVSSVHTGTAGIEAARRQEYDVILLDMLLPDISGIEVLRHLRTETRAPVVILSAHNEETDRIVTLELGADDYVVKPFDPRELLARIRTVLRRASDKGQAAAQSDIRRFAGWTLNVRSRELSQGDERIALSDAMYRLLFVFLDEPFAVLSREYLLRQTQGRDADVFDRSVDIQVSRLRGVLKDTGTSKIIKTVRGGGYMLSVDVEHDA